MNTNIAFPIRDISAYIASVHELQAYAQKSFPNPNDYFNPRSKRKLPLKAKHNTTIKFRLQASLDHKKRLELKRNHHSRLQELHRANKLAEEVILYRELQSTCDFPGDWAGRLVLDTATRAERDGHPGAIMDGHTKSAEFIAQKAKEMDEKVFSSYGEACEELRRFEVMFDMVGERYKLDYGVGAYERDFDVAGRSAKKAREDREEHLNSRWKEYGESRQDVGNDGKALRAALVSWMDGI